MMVFVRRTCQRIVCTSRSLHAVLDLLGVAENSDISSEFICRTDLHHFRH